MYAKFATDFFINGNFNAVSCDTTGISLVNDRIVSLSIVPVRGGEIQSKLYDKHLNPSGVKVSDDAVAAHGIKNRMLSSCKRFSEESDAIHDILSSVPTVSINRFCLLFLNEELSRSGKNCIPFSLTLSELEDNTSTDIQSPSYRDLCLRYLNVVPDKNDTLSYALHTAKLALSMLVQLVAARDAALGILND